MVSIFFSSNIPCVFRLGNVYENVLGAENTISPAVGQDGHNNIPVGQDGHSLPNGMEEVETGRNETDDRPPIQEMTDQTHENQEPATLHNDTYESVNHKLASMKTQVNESENQRLPVPENLGQNLDTEEHIPIDTHKNLIPAPASLGVDDHEYGNQEFVGRPIRIHALANFLENMQKRPEAFKEEFNVSVCSGKKSL